MKKPFYYTIKNSKISVYQIEGDVPRLITTLMCFGLYENDVIKYLIENKLGDENSTIIRL